MTKRVVRFCAFLLLLWLPSPSEPAWRLVDGMVKDAGGNAIKFRCADQKTNLTRWSGVTSLVLTGAIASAR
jgi:hypothetical protein